MGRGNRDARSCSHVAVVDGGWKEERQAPPPSGADPAAACDGGVATGGGGGPDTSGRRGGVRASRAKGCVVTLFGHLLFRTSPKKLSLAAAPDTGGSYLLKLRRWWRRTPDGGEHPMEKPGSPTPGKTKRAAATRESREDQPHGSRRPYCHPGHAPGSCESGGYSRGFSGG